MARRCSFCGQDDRTGERLVVAHGGAAICGDCARLAVELSSDRDDLMSGDLLLTGIGRLVTNDPRHGGLLGVIEGAAVALRHGKVTWLGRQRSLPDRYRDLPEIDCEDRMVAPGFVDTHRHLSPPSDAAASVELGPMTDLVALHLGATLEQGATTVEIRTWGAPGPEAEVTMLSAIRAAGETLPSDVIPSVVAGTEVPFRGRGYLHMLETVLVPTASRIARYLDVVVGASLDGAAAVSLLEVGRGHGMRLRVHVEGDDALEAALRCRAVTVDGFWGMEEAAGTVADSGMAVVCLPGVSWITGRPDPARSMWDAGVTVALGTGCADGSVPTIPMAMAAAVHHGGLGAGEALWAATRGGALAVEEPDKGIIAPGSVADLIVLEGVAPSDVVGEPGRDPVVRVIKDGALLGT